MSFNSRIVFSIFSILDVCICVPCLYASSVQFPLRLLRRITYCIYYCSFWLRLRYSARNTVLVLRAVFARPFQRQYTFTGGYVSVHNAISVRPSFFSRTINSSCALLFLKLVVHLLLSIMVMQLGTHHATCLASLSPSSQCSSFRCIYSAPYFFASCSFKCFAPSRRPPVLPPPSCHSQ